MHGLPRRPDDMPTLNGYQAARNAGFNGLEAYTAGARFDDTLVQASQTDFAYLPGSPEDTSSDPFMPGRPSLELVQKHVDAGLATQDAALEEMSRRIGGYTL